MANRETYFLNPAVRKYLGRNNLSQIKFAEQQGMSDTYFSDALQQNVTVGPKTRERILVGLAKVLGERPKFEAIFSEVSYPVKDKAIRDCGGS